MWNKQENRNVNQESQLCVSAGDVDDSTESTNFENDSNSVDEYNSFVLELNKDTSPKSYCTNDCPEKESFLHGSLVFVPTGVPITDIVVAEDNTASEAPLGNVEVDCDNIPKSSNPDPKIRDISYFLRRRRSVVKRRFLVFVFVTIFLAVGSILTKNFTGHQKRTPKAAVVFDPSGNGTGDSSEEKLALLNNDKVYVSSHRNRSEEKHFTQIFKPPRHITFTPIFAPPRDITDEIEGSTETKARTGKSSRKHHNHNHNHNHNHKLT